MKRTLSYTTPHVAAHRALSASPMPTASPIDGAKQPALQIDESLFRGWKPNVQQRSSVEIRDKEPRVTQASSAENPSPSSMLDSLQPPVLPTFKPTTLTVPGFENVATLSEERIQMYKDMKSLALQDGHAGVEHELKVIEVKPKEMLASNLPSVVPGLTMPRSEATTTKRLLFDAPKKTDEEDLTGERLSTMTVKIFKNEVVQENQGLGSNRAKFRLTVNRIGMIEIYAKITKILESPTEALPRLVILISDDSCNDTLEAFYYDQDASKLVSKIDFSNWYQMIGTPKFQSDHSAVLHLFSIREVVNLGELEYSKSMIKATEKYFPK